VNKEKSQNGQGLILGKSILSEFW